MPPRLLKKKKTVWYIFDEKHDIEVKLLHVCVRTLQQKSAAMILRAANLWWWVLTSKVTVRSLFRYAAFNCGYKNS